MGERVKKTTKREIPAEECGIRIWSGDCAHVDEKTGKKVYTCDLCGTISNLDHEIHHDTFPHVCGDTDKLS